MPPRRSISRNTALNGITHLLLILASFLSYPIIASSVSTEGFGLLTIIWMLVGYLGIFDLGLGWAAARIVAQAAARDDAAMISRIGWNANLFGLALGSFIGVLLFLFHDNLVIDALDVHGPLTEDALSSLVWVACAIPFAVVNGIGRGVLQGLERFDIINANQIAMAAVQWIGSIAVVKMGYGVLEIVIVAVVARVVFASLVVVWQVRVIPGMLKPDRIIDIPLVKTILTFGGWVTISRIISPLFLYFDRLIVGAILSLQVAAYYSVPQDVISRLLIIPMSLTMALFPVFSGDLDFKTIMPTFTRSLRYLLVVIVPIVLVLMVFSMEILEFWMGAEFAQGAGKAFGILSIGFLFNSLAQLPMTLLLSRGRPDLPAKFHLIEFPVAMVLAVILLKSYGITGIAFAWTLRVMVDSALLFYSSSRNVPAGFSFKPTIVNLRRTLLTVTALSIGFLILFFVESLKAKWGLAAAMVVAYAVVAWRFLLDNTDRKMLTTLHVSPGSRTL